MDLQKISLDSFRIFVFVSDLGSISRASEQMDINQSTLSRRIQQLELETGLELLERNSRGVSLTKAGYVVYDFAKDILEKLSCLEDQLLIRKENLSNITIGSYGSIVSYIYPDFFSEKLHQFKKITITNDTEKLINAFNVYDLDSIIVDSEFRNELSGVKKEIPVFSEPFYIVYSTQNKKALEVKNHNISPEILSDFKLILYPSTCPIHRKVLNFYQEHGKSPDIRQVEFGASAISFVLRTDMVTVLPKSVAISHVTKSLDGLGMRQLGPEFDRHISLFSRTEQNNQLILENGLNGYQ